MILVLFMEINKTRINKVYIFNPDINSFIIATLFP